MDKKIKGMSKSALSTLLAMGALASPTSVLANEIGESGELVGADGGGYDFSYRKNITSKLTDKTSIYGLKLTHGKDKSGKPFKASEKQIKEASVMFESGDGERGGEVKYDGIYDLIHLQREPGLYPRLGGLMYNADEGEKLQGFDFPTMDRKQMKVEREIQMKEDEFLQKLEVILQNEKRFGLKGTFSLDRVANPDEVYGQFTKDEIEKVYKDVNENYNAPETKEDANRVKSWKKLDEDVHIAELATKDVAKKVIDEDLEDSQLTFVSDLEDDIVEGVYVLTQKTTDVRYNIRPAVVFAVTMNDKAEPIIEFITTVDNAEDMDKFFDEFEQLKVHDNEQFKFGDAGHEQDIYQALLVNFAKPGFRPVDPNDPDNPTDPNKPNDPSENPPATPEFFKEINRKAQLNTAFEEAEKEAVAKEEDLKGDHVKVNIGEIFEFNFDMFIPEDVVKYEKLQFQDFFDDAVNIEEAEVRILHDGKDITETVIGENSGKGQDLRVNFIPENMEEVAGETIQIIIDKVFLEKDTVENVKNRGYIHYKVGKNETPEVPEGEKPNDPDVIDPNDPTKPFNPTDPNDPGTIDPENPPTIPTTPEVVVDPINVDFRMGVVDPGTTVLDKAMYELKEFIPARGEGGITEDGKIKVGEIIYDIEKEIDASEGFVKLENLPAGKYTMKETVAPVKGDDQYRLVTDELTFIVHEDEKHITIVNPIVKNGEELAGKLIDAETLYRKGENSTVRNEENWNNKEVNDKEAMLHHYRYINTPATGTLAGIPFFLGGGALVSAGIMINKKKKED